MKKFTSNLVMFLIFVACEALSIVLFMKMEKVGLIVGIILAVVYAIVCFTVKRVRSKMTTWWGTLSLGSAIWWAYLLTQ
jgi:uncharacterized membrane protein YwaF